jgi:NitT/TauT family transport system permease protein
LVLDRLTFQIEPGEFVALLGPSGSGKSSLLRLTAGLDRADAGRLVIEAEQGTVSRGFVFQEATLIPWRNVLRNTTLPLELQGWEMERAKARAQEELWRVRLMEFAAPCSATAAARDLGCARDDGFVRYALDFRSGISRQPDHCAITAASPHTAGQFDSAHRNAHSRAPHLFCLCGRSPTHRYGGSDARTRDMNFKTKISSLLPPLLPLILGMALAEITVRSGWVPSYLIPAPSEVIRSLIDDRVELAVAAWTTLSSALAGLLLSFTTGTLFAIALSASDLARRAFYPYAVFFQTVPIISIAPLLVIWFGFGQPTVIASAAIVSVFPIIASTLLGLKSTEPALIDLFTLYSASARQMLYMLKIPFALPQIFSGLRIASGLAVVGAIVGEFIGGGGLGSVVDSARTQQRIDRVFAAVLISALLGAVLVGAVNLISALTLGSWHISERKAS